MTQAHLVLIHGWGIGSYCWQPCLDALTPYAEVQCIDLPGYGKSLPQATTFETAAHQILEACPADSILCGWSLGALLAMQAALTAPARIRGLILVGATPCFMQRPDWFCAQPSAVFGTFTEQVKGDSQATLLRFIALCNQTDSHSHRLTRMLTRQMLDAAPVSWETLTKGLGWLRDIDLREQISAIHVPTCLIHGQQDPLMPIEAVKWLQGHLAHTQLHMIANAGHIPFLNNPDFFARTVGHYCHELTRSKKTHPCLI